MKNQKLPFLSIIIPCYNAEDTIEKCLKSILSQTYEDYEVVIYDDCSTDLTSRKIEGYIQKSKKIIYYKSYKNEGQGIARNRALDNLISGEVVTFLDADDYFENKNYLTEACSLMSKNRLDILFTPAYRKIKSLPLKKDSFDCPDGFYTKERIANSYISRGFGTHAAWAKFYNRKILKDVRFVDYGYSQDVLFVLNAIKASMRIYVTSLYGYVYSQESESTWRTPVINVKHIASSIRLLAEVYLYSREDRSVSLYKFLKTWNVDHGKRIKRYILQRNASDDDKKIIGSFIGALGELGLSTISLIDSALIRRFLIDVAEQTNQNNALLSQEYIPWLEYAQLLKNRFLQNEKVNVSSQAFVISLTSYPKRIHQCSRVIESVVNQELPAGTQVVLYLSKDEFSNVSELPEDLRKISQKFNVKIRLLDGNIKSYKKLIPALEEFPESAILTIDDDIIYPKGFVSALFKSYMAAPMYIHATRCRVIKIGKKEILPYRSWGLLQDDKFREPSFDLLFTGSGGVLYPPHSLNPLVTREDLFLSLCPTNDDIWFWLMSVLKGSRVNRVIIDLESLENIASEKDDSLWTVNSVGGNDTAIIAIQKEFPFIVNLLTHDLLVPIELEKGGRRRLSNLLYKCLKKIIYKFYK